MPEAEKTFQKRQTAYKTRISDIINSSFSKDESSAGFVKFNGVNVSRVNVIANVVYRPEEGQDQSRAMIDDGTGRITLRTFDNADLFSKVEIGDVVIVIGKIREYDNERYILPEIVKKLDKIEWMSLRKSELKDIKTESKKEDSSIPAEENPSNSNELLYSVIRKLDAGDGVSVEDIEKESNNPDAEKIIAKLLESGDIFEIKPGKLKVLE